MSAHGPMPRSAWIFPALSVLFFAGATALGTTFTPSAAGLVFAAVLLVSSDLDEVAGICHRALIFNRGRIVEELQRPELSVARLTAVVGGATQTSGVG